MTDPATSAAEIYAQVKAAFDEHELRGARHHEWLRLTTSILEAVMKCQALVIDNQRAVLDRARSERGEVGSGDLRQLRAEAKDALYYVERLTQLYERIKVKLAEPPPLT